ncbi:MAG: hypothetical protein GC178_03820 [Flavobacteriales bacterium]|nr:hypothetical protein [Flavobacteriales bacterium]
MDISSAITPLAVTLVMALLVAASKKKPKEDKKGNKILRLPVLYPIIGGFATIAGLTVLVYGLWTCEPDETIFVLMLFLMASGLGIPLLLIGIVFKLVITPDQLEQTTMLGKIKTMKWVDIESVTFGKVSLELKIRSKDQQIKAHMHLVGFPYLIDEIESNTKFNRQEMGIPQI